MRLTIVEMDEFYIAGIEIGLGVDWDEYFEAPDPVLSEIVNADFILTHHRRFRIDPPGDFLLVRW